MILQNAVLLFLPTLNLVTASVFTISIFAPNNPFFHKLPINAAGQAFYAGLTTPATYCPAIVPQCPHNGTPIETVFAGMAALWVEVPGGQQVYTNFDGTLGFTQAHSSYVPRGAFIGGYVNMTEYVEYGIVSTVLTWPISYSARGGIYACPVSELDTSFKVFAGTAGFNRTDCTEVVGLLPDLVHSRDFGAWQYT